MLEQGIGQVSLELNGRDNESILKDDSIKDEYKRKIKLVIKAKKYFFDYFAMEENTIYDQTTFLDQKAVTYLVIHSPHDQIKALKSCFPIAGCFPYQGFFNLDSAKDYKKQKEELGHHTFMRPVYAYSTLNHPLIPFSDNILSSFFHYQDNDLVQLIFHELVHTIIFVKNEAQFNENLAEFVSQVMLIDYLKLESNYFEKKKADREMQRKLNQKVVGLSKTLKEEYAKKANKPDYILRNFLENNFNPSIKKYCQENGLHEKSCWPLKQKWNNARFAALGTYVAKQNKIKDIYDKTGLNLKAFVYKLIELEDDFDSKKKFINYIEKEMVKK